MQEKYKYLTKNTLLFAISSFGTKFLSLLLLPVYTNVLSTAEYGIADIVTTTATLMIYVFTLNISDSVLRFAIERKEKQNEILSFGIRVLLISSSLLIFFLIIAWGLQFVEWSIYFYLFIFLYYFFMALYQIMANYLRAIDKVQDVAKAGVFSAVAMITGNIFFLLIIKIGIYGYLISLILAPFIGTIYCFIKARISLRKYLINVCDKRIQKAMIVYSVPLIFNSIALWINAFLDKYFVTAFCGVEQNGIYAVSIKIPTILSTCYMVFSQAWNLSAIKEFDGEDKDNFFAKTYTVYNAAITFVCSVLILFNIPIAKVLFAKDFFEAWNYSSVLLISVMFNAMTSFLGSIFIAVKNSRIIATTTLISAGINILLNLLLIPSLGVQGAAIATAVSYAVMWGIRLIFSQKYIKLKLNIFKDLIVYGLLIIQVLLEHLEKHCYAGQIVILILITIIYHNYIVSIFTQILGRISKKGNN